jgi:hypothetical protein
MGQVAYLIIVSSKFNEIANAYQKLAKYNSALQNVRCYFTAMIAVVAMINNDNLY